MFGNAETPRLTEPAKIGFLIASFTPARPAGINSFNFKKMNIKIEDINTTRKAATVAVPASVIEENRAKLLKEYASQVKLPGFRPGKAPASIVAGKFAKELQQELVQSVVQAAYKEIGENKEIEIYSLVEVKEPTVEAGKDAEIRFEIDVVPAFTLPEYKGISVPAEDTSVSEDDIAKAIEGIRSQRAEFNKTEDAAEKGDFVKLSYEGKIDGAEFPAEATVYGKQTGTWEEAGSEDAFGASVKEIALALVGVKPGEKKEVSVTFADDFANEALRGKTAVYTLDVAEVRRRVLPELNEEFFKSVHVENEENFRKQVSEGLEANKKNAAKTKTREAVINKLNEAVDFELPESAIEREAYNIFVEFANAQLRQGMKVEDIEAKRDEIMANTKEAAKTRVKTQIILNAIAKAENVKVEQADITSRIQQEAYMSGMPVEKFVKELTKDKTRLMEMQQNIRYNKALDIAVESAKIG